MVRILTGRKYVEAFCLMKYRNEYDGYVEWIWNSRDGISPFVVSDIRTELRGSPPHHLTMLHDDWHEDVPIPNYIPPIGSRIFMDMHDYDPNRHDFNLRTVLVTADIRATFLVNAWKDPWIPQPRSKG